MTLLAGDLLLLLLDDEKGTVAASSNVPPALGGALLAELALDGLVEVEEKRGFWHAARVRAVPGAVTPSDPVLAAALATIVAKERTAQHVVGRLGKGLRDDLLASLRRRGMVEERADRVLGIFPRRRWPAADFSHEEQVRRAVTVALVEGVEPDDRTRALVALLHAVGRAARTVDHTGLPASAVRKRAKQLADGEWAAKAVGDAIAASSAAVTTAVAASAAAAGSS